MNKKKVLALLTGLAGGAVALVAGVTYQRGDWSKLEPVVATVPPAEEKTAEQPGKTAQVTDQSQPPQPTEAKQAGTDQSTPQQSSTDQQATNQAAPSAESVVTKQEPPSTTDVSKPPETANAEAEPKATTTPEESAKAQSEPPKETTIEQQEAPPPAKSEVAAKPETAPSTESETQQKSPPAPAPTTAETTVKPAFDTVRVEKSGEALAAGTAAPGSEIVLKLNGKAVGNTVANAEGAWVVVPDTPLPPGLGQLTAEQKRPGSTNFESSEQSVAIVVPASVTQKGPLVALVEPGSPTEILQKPAVEPKPVVEPKPEAEAIATPETSPSTTDESNTAQPEAKSPEPELPVTLDTVDYNDRGDIVFSGRAGAGANVRLYIDNKPLADAEAAADGKWTYLGKSEIAPGSHSLRVDQIDKEGKVINRIELPFQREEPERVVAMKQPEAEPAPPETAPEQTPPPAEKQVEQVVQPEMQAEVPVETPTSEPQKPAVETQTVAVTPAPTEPETVKPRSGKIVIQPGNNLWKLSRVIYGRGTDYTVIYEANKDQIRNPDRIYPGQIFTTPNVSPPEKIDPKRRQPLSAEEAGASQ